MNAPDDPSARQKLDALQRRESSSDTVAKIESAGHTASAAATGAYMGYGAISAYGAGGIGAVACYAAPLAAGIAGIVAGAALVNYFALDEKLLDVLGKPKPAGRGPQPATLGHAIAHTSPFAGAMGGLLSGVIAGAVVGALVAGAIAGTVLSGGLLGPVIIGAAACFGGSLVGALVNGFFSKSATITGRIVEGSPDVFFEGRPVARVTDKVLCDKHSPPTQIAEGSETIFINGLPLARIGHQTTCGAIIQEGCATIFADTTTGQYGPIDSQMSVLEQSVVSIAEVALCLSAVRFRSSKLGKLVLGEPIDPSDGGYVDFRADFEYDGILPLALTRVYAGRDTVEGILGTKWICNWSQRLRYDPSGKTVNLEDGDGEILQFALGKRSEFNSRNLKASHYHLTGSRENARLFDSRNQRTLMFAATEGNPDTGLLTAVEDRNGNRIDFIYENGCLRRVEHSDGEIFIVRTTPEGFIETVTRDGDGEPLVRYRYDSSGALTDVESLFNGEFHYRYNEHGLLTHWRDSGATSVDLEYDAEGRVIATRAPEGLYNDRFVYVPEERKTTYIDATGARAALWFNENNLPVREQDPLGNITLHEWDGLDREQSTTDALGRVTLFEYDPYGNLAGETDWAGRSTRLTYDRHGQITRIEYPDGTAATWKYDDRGNLIESGEPDGSVYRFSYDDNGRLISETGPDGTSNRIGYDTNGRLSSVRNALGRITGYSLDARNRPLRITDPAGYITRYEYDRSPENPRGDISRIIHPDGGEERFTYDREGLPATHIAPEGQTTQYLHGSFDLLRGITDPKGHSTNLEYDGAARLKRITNAQGQTWSYSYDPAGRLSGETDWAGRRTGYTRDAGGRVVARRLPDGVEQRLTWDDRDRIVAVETATQRITYEYDTSDRLTNASTFTRKSPEPESELSFSYDDKGRLTKETRNGITIEYEYDAAGRCISRASPTGETRYGYDPLGQLETLESNGHGLDFIRDARGLETERRYRAGGATPLDAFTLKQSYDQCGRLKGQMAGRARHLTAYERLAEVSRRYRLDKSGRVIGLEDNKRGASSYRYDPRDQITLITHRTGLNKQSEEKYGYDELLNLTHGNGRTHRYEGGTVRAIGKNSYRYDLRGRVIEKKVERNGFRPGTWRYSWDDFDRLVETSAPDGSIWKYTYDAFGRRIRKECVKAGKSGKQPATHYLWQGATLIEEWKTDPDEDGSPLAINRWHYEPGTFNPVAGETRTLSNGGDTGSHFYPIVTDHLGTPKEVFTIDGELIWQADHTLWGRLSEVKRKEDENYRPVVDCSLRFQNQWEDEESGLYYNLNRYYDPDSGQYLSPDPIGLEGGLRNHGYVHDPMQWVDPWGLCKGNKNSIPLNNNSVRKLLKSRGLSKQQARDITSSFDGQIYATPGRAGEGFIVTESAPGRGSGVFVTRGSAGATPAKRIQRLALPPSNTAQVESPVALTRDQLLLEGRVAPQPRWGANKTGGGWQVVTNGGRRTGAVAP